MALQAASAGDGASSLNQLSSGGLGLLHLFAALGYEWGMTALLLAGAAVNLRDAQGRTALHWAAARGHEAITCMLQLALTALSLRHAGPASSAAMCALKHTMQTSSVIYDVSVDRWEIWQSLPLN